MNFVEEFFVNAVLPKAITSSFLTLIPKKDHPESLSDYRPICLIGCLYKILSKLLANRLKRVLGKLISPCQSAFLPSRQILDGVVVLNEIIDLAKRRKDRCMFFKVDFEKAYDTINWNFLERMMIKMGFAEGWMKWIRACIFNSSMSVLVNGSATEDFKVCRGLRQGDPLSPFLFLIVAESLTGLIKRAVEIGKFQGYKVTDSLQFQILQFADDTILVGEDSWNNLWTIKSVLRGFELVSGLKINFIKSKLYGINVDESFLMAGASFLSCSSDIIPFKFLGIPVGANPRRRDTWRPVVDAMMKRLNTWSGRQLSYGGRITLINSVLASLPVYFFSFFKAPKCVINQLVRIQRNFLWGGGLEDKKLCWVKWDQVCRAKEQGGLGVKNLEFFNIALLTDRLSSSREGLVWKWEWRDVLTQEEEIDLLKLKELLVDINLNLNCADRWRWIPGDAGLFSVKSCYNFLVQFVTVENLNPSMLEAVKKLWKNDVPSKVNVFGWRLLLEKLPTRDALASKGIITNPHETCCVFCFRHVEDCSHIFYHCKFSQLVWSAIFKWLGCSITIGEEGLNHFFKCGDLVKGHRVRHLIWLTTNWCLWRLRNNIIFRGEVADVSKLIDNITAISWIWFSGRAGRKSTFSFADWCTNPIACLQSI
ncbi:unnamed protein product [Trifolium pratense]|uniref:Uncharacterized protein n=1 Tax=Trifolium pratense TaxID=57577 RepID=A0ACB0IZ45_TRIPR|nr:unnamed protein product [Trifolium pratense]